MTICKCPHCGGEITPASLLGKGKKKTVTPASIAARQANGKKGGRPKKLSSGKLPVEQEPHPRSS